MSQTPSEPLVSGGRGRSAADPAAAAPLPLVLRREPFGGILFEPTDATHLELDPDGHSFLRGWLAGERQPETDAERAFLATIVDEVPRLRGGPQPTRFADLPPTLGRTRHATVLGSPTLCDLQLTRRCRMGCPHCYASSTPEGEHMPFEELCRILEELAEAGVCQLALGGGEPLLHPRIVEILERIHALGMVPNLTTTGDGLTPAVLEACARCCGAVALSLEGVGEAFALRRRSGFAFFEETLGVLRRRGIRTVFQVTLGAENLPRLSSIVDYCLELGSELYGVIFLAYKSVGRGEGYDAPLSALDPGELYPRLREAFRRLAHHTRVGYDCCLTPGIAGIDVELGSLDHHLLEGCSAARTSVGIGVDLEVVPCTFLSHRPLGNLRERSFLEIWRGPEAEAFRARLDARVDRDPDCRVCESRTSCLGGCPEWDLVRCSLSVAAGQGSTVAGGE